MVPVGKSGRTVSSPIPAYAGWTIRIEDDGVGLLILLISNPDRNDSKGWDVWRPDEAAVERYLRDFVIEWEP